jgi:hypothetical protein
LMTFSRMKKTAAIAQVAKDKNIEPQSCRGRYDSGAALLGYEKSTRKWAVQFRVFFTDKMIILSLHRHSLMEIKYEITIYRPTRGCRFEWRCRRFALSTCTTETRRFTDHYNGHEGTRLQVAHDHLERNSGWVFSATRQSHKAHSLLAIIDHTKLARFWCRFAGTSERAQCRAVSITPYSQKFIRCAWQRKGPRRLKIERGLEKFHDYFTTKPLSPSTSRALRPHRSDA